MARIILCVTNSLHFDQRLARICTTLAGTGHEVLLVGRKNAGSQPLKPKPYRQHRMRLIFSKGKWFYAEYQLRLFFFLLTQKADAVIANDLDTIIPVYYSSRIKGWKIAIDAHEYFTGQIEVVSRPGVFRFWKWVERKFLPKYRSGYTVSDGIARLFKEEYNLNYEVIRNVPKYKLHQPHKFCNNPLLIYRGAVNEGRGLKELAEAMKNLPLTLNIYGDGNFMLQLQKRISENNMAGRMVINGAVLPEDLDMATETSDIGLNLVENNGKNQFHSLANKFFDMIMHGLPQVTMDFPEYRAINKQFEVAVLIAECTPEAIELGVRKLMQNQELYTRLSNNCIRAAKVLNWETEQIKLISFYERFLG